MDMQERKEREISLTDLFWRVLLGWRQMICFGILFAVLLGGMRYVLDVRNYRAARNIDAEAVKEDMDEEDLRKLEDAVNLQKRIDNFENYLEKSAVMQMDPYAKPVLELQYRVQSDYVINYTKDSGRDYTPELVSMYCNYVSGGEMAQSVIDGLSLPVSKEDFVELVAVTSPRAEDSGSIFFTVSYAEEARLGEIADAVKGLLERKSAEFQKVGGHELQLINESQSVVVDNALADRKNSISSTIYSLGVQLRNLRDDMTGEQKALLDMELRKLRGEAPKDEEEPGVRRLYIILGGMAGVFLVCLWTACKMIFASKLQSCGEIHSLYGLRLLGEIERPGRKKRFLPVIDRLILSAKNRGRKQLTQERQIEMAAAGAALFCRRRGIGGIYLTGSEYENADQAILDKLKAKLAGQGLKVQEGGNMRYDAASLQAGIENGHIVLVEQIGLSSYDEIYAQLDLAKECGGEVLGAVVLS